MLTIIDNLSLRMWSLRFEDELDCANSMVKKQKRPPARRAVQTRPPARRRVIFLLGRPGCGKSHVFRRLERMLSGPVSRVDDFPKLLALAQQDDELESKGLPRQHTDSANGKWFAHQRAYEQVLSDLNDELIAEKSTRRGYVFVELARWEPERARSCRSGDRM